MDNLRPEWLPQEQYPFHLETTRIAGSEITYVDEGDGPTLVFVNAGIWSFVFRDVITRLRSDFRCITLDFPGYGLSDPAECDMDIAAMADLFEEFVTSLDLTDITLVAHDLGGPVSLHAAGKASDRFAGLVLANTFGWTPDTGGLRTMLRLLGSRAMTALGTTTNLVPRFTATSFGVGRHLDEAGRQAFLGPYRDRTVRRRFHKTMRSAIRDSEFTDQVEKATKGPLNGLPVLTIFGERNDPFGFQPRHASVFPDLEAVVVEKGNHFPMMDDPDLFARSVADWHSRKVAAVRS